MAELNISNLFHNVSGNNNIIDKTDVEAGRLDKDIAKALGIIDENGNYTDVTYTEDQIDSNGGIDELFRRVRQQGSKVIENKNNNAVGKRVNENGSKAVSQEKFTYQPGNAPIEGTLIKYEDGSFEFIDRMDALFGYSAKFKNEDDLKAKRPYQTVRATFKKGSSNKGKVITDFEYYPDGKLKNEKQLNEKGVVLKELQKDNKGYLISEKRYDENGKLISSKEGKWVEDNLWVMITKNDKGELTRKQVVKTDGNKKVLSRVYNKDNILISEISYDNEGKMHKLTNYRDDGTLKKELEYINGGKGIQSEKIYDKDGKLVSEYTADFVPDGKNWDKPSAQVGQGDCYLLSSINAIRELDDGAKMLSDLIDIKTDESGKKIYTVTLPGAKIAADSLKRDGLKVAITGTYTFTEEEFEEIAKRQGTSYSLGNANVILLEAAFEKYRKEVQKTVQDNNIKVNGSNDDIVGLEGASGQLAAGLAFDATFVLLGKNSKVYMVENTGKGLDNKALQEGRIVIVGKEKGDMHEAGVSSFEDGKSTSEQADMKKMLDEIMKDMKDGKKDIIATAAFKIYQNGKPSGGHAFTIKEVTEDSVTIINPWFPEKTLTMSRADFMEIATKLSISDSSKESNFAERNVNPNGGKSVNPGHSHKEEPYSERPVSDAEKKEINDMIKRFFGGGKSDQPKGKKPTAQSKQAFDIMNRAITKSPVKSNPDNKSKQKEPKLSQTEEEQTKKQLSDYIKRIRKK